MNVEEIVEGLNKHFKKTIFEISIRGSFNRPLYTLNPGENKYVYIFNKEDIEIESAYIDFKYEEFSIDIIRQYAEEIPEKQGKGDIDRITLEYLKLGELIIKFLNKNETKIIL